MSNTPSESLPSPPGQPARGRSLQASNQSSSGLVPFGTYHYREVVEESITPNDYPRLISLVRTLAPETGSAREVGEGLQWERDTGNAEFSLTLNPEPAGTVIRADLRTQKAQPLFALGAFAVSVVASIAAGVAQLPVGGIVATGLSTLVASGFVARHLWRGWSRREAARLEHLVGRLAAALRGDLD